MGASGEIELVDARRVRDFVLARELVNSVIAAYSARIHSEDDIQARLRLVAEQRNYARELRNLTVDDHATVMRILSEYPAIASDVRDNPRP